MGRTECPNLKWITSEPWVGCAQSIYESEMALFPDCKESCAQEVVDTADIVRDAICVFNALIVFVTVRYRTIQTSNCFL
jgi:hypothetical protein